MAVNIDLASFRTGFCAPVTFGAAGYPGDSCGNHGDWQTFHVPFQPAFPAAADGAIRVLVSASDAGADINVHQAVPVPIVGEVSPLGFTVWARNTDVSGGDSGLSWIAVSEVPDTIGTSTASPARVRTGLLQPQHFQSDGYRGDWRRWSVQYGQRVGFEVIPGVVVTTTNGNVRVHAAASVGVACGVSKVGFNLAARNSDVGPGVCSFAYLAVQRDAGGEPSQMVDTGQVPGRYFQSNGVSGDWQVWNVQFNEPFLVPPTIMLTADNSNGTLYSYARAAVGVVFDATGDGFTLAARNSDPSAGPVGFSWVAVGRPAYR
jgi:hypothetical protein